jgi:luciferase family oxidoreductase group 1
MGGTGRSTRAAALSTRVSQLPSLPLSVLDLAPVGTGRTPSEAVSDTLALAERADALGFTRFWVAEHHGMPGVASSAPAVLIGALADRTRHIRVGSGGVMLPNHAALVVAEQFGTLAALHPGRIDLGIGRAPGTDPRTAAALGRSLPPGGPDGFPEQLGELGCFLAGEFPNGHPLAGVHAVPRPEQAPPIWLLGSSLYSAELAGLLGLPFAFAHHFSSAATLPALARYRESFRPGRTLDEPYAMVTVQVVCAPTDEQAEQLALPSALAFLRLRQGRPGTLPTPDDAAAHPWTEPERAFVAERRKGQAVGAPATVAAALGQLLAATRPDELMITSQLYDGADRIRSLELVRGLFGELVPGLHRA